MARNNFGFKELGLSREDISDICYSTNVSDAQQGIFHPFIKHTESCRTANPKGIGKPFECVCDFTERLCARVFGIVYDGFEA